MHQALLNSCDQTWGFADLLAGLDQWSRLQSTDLQAHRKSHSLLMDPLACAHAKQKTSSSFQSPCVWEQLGWRCLQAHATMR